MRPNLVKIDRNDGIITEDAKRLIASCIPVVLVKDHSLRGRLIADYVDENNLEDVLADIERKYYITHFFVCPKINYNYGKKYY